MMMMMMTIHVLFNFFPLFEVAGNLWFDMLALF